ncbi:MAG: hypothetical protein MZV63_06045 [Marinilabiliales bacterium]|nr:hypothetical protein [Marinilabiliales bacterium]
MTDPANSGALDLRPFRAAVDSKGLFGVNASEVMPHLDISIGLVLDYGYNVFPVTALNWTDANDDRVVDASEASTTDGHLVTHAIDANLGFNIGLFNFMAVGFSLPIVIASGGQTMGVAGWERWTGAVGPTAPDPTPSFSAQHVGDLEVHAKFRILRAERNPVGLGAIVHFLHAHRPGRPGPRL